MYTHMHNLIAYITNHSTKGVPHLTNTNVWNLEQASCCLSVEEYTEIYRHI